MNMWRRHIKRDENKVWRQDMTYKKSFAHAKSRQEINKQRKSHPLRQLPATNAYISTSVDSPHDLRRRGFGADTPAGSSFDELVGEAEKTSEEQIQFVRESNIYQQRIDYSTVVEYADKLREVGGGLAPRPSDLLFRDHLRTLDYDVEMAFTAWLDFDRYGVRLPSLNPANVAKGLITEDDLGNLVTWTDSQVEKAIRFYAAMHEVSVF